MPPPYPAPRETTTNAPMLAAWRAGSLALQRCRGCGIVFWVPRPLCPSCWSEQLDWLIAEGRGTVVSFSLIQKPLHPAFEDEVPVVLAEISLPEGAALLARVVGNDRTEVASGRAVRLISSELAARYPLPTFELA